MRAVELFFVLLVEHCLIDVLSGLNWKQDGSFNPEEHENYKLLPPKNSCGTNGLATQTESEKIVGGYETKLGGIPWIVLYGFYIFSFHPRCGGNLISERYVLIAAHCIKFENASFVRLGEWNTTVNPDSQGDLHAPPFQEIKIVDTIPHEHYNLHRGVKNDIALLQLETKAKLSYFVQPVCLPYGAAMSKDFTSEDTLAAGWGSTTGKPSTLPTILLAVKLTVADATKCKEAYSKKDLDVNYNDGQICAGGEEGKGICFGDSGGPLLWKGSFEPDSITVRTYLLGLTSHGADKNKCAIKGFPGIFTRTNFFMKWILDNMRA